MGEPDRSPSVQPEPTTGSSDVADEVPVEWRPDGFEPLARAPRDLPDWDPPALAFVGLGFLLSSIAIGWVVLGDLVPAVGEYGRVGYVGTYAVTVAVIYRRCDRGPDRRIAEILLGVFLPYLLLVAGALLFG